MKFLLIITIGSNLLFPQNPAAFDTYADCERASELATNVYTGKEPIEAKCFDTNGRWLSTSGRG